MIHGSYFGLVHQFAGLLMYFFHSKILERIITCGCCLVQQRSPKTEANQDFDSGLLLLLSYYFIIHFSFNVRNENVSVELFLLMYWTAKWDIVDSPKACWQRATAPEQHKAIFPHTYLYPFLNHPSLSGTETLKISVWFVTGGTKYAIFFGKCLD